MSMDSAGFRFVSHQRRGLIALPGVASSGTFTASVQLSDGSSSTPVTFALPGAGDVLGIDTTLVTRQYPRPGATDAETEFFPLVEFSVPELPWLLPTPSGPKGAIPWLCLVVVELREGVSLAPGGLGTPARLQISDPAHPSDELPDPADSPLWAHAFANTQAHTADGADPVEVGSGSPIGGCRLIAPRRLRAGKNYLACLVPTLAATALAGLGHSDVDVAAALAAPQPNWAWSSDAASVELPVYLSWEFACIAAGDFETLARSIHEVPVDGKFGTRPLDLGLAGRGMPVTSGATTILRGALTAPGTADESAWPLAGNHDEVRVDTALTAEIASAAKLTMQAGARGRPVIGPLLYARAAAGRIDVSAKKPIGDWFDQLNRDPRARAVAGFGTRVLRRNVEEVMARAWEQLGDVEAANAALRLLQASRMVSISLHERHLAGLSPGRLIAVARPLLARVMVPPSASGGTQAATALAAVAASALPAGTTWRSLGVTLRRGTALGNAAQGTDVAGQVVATLLPGIPERDIVPDGTIGLTTPSAVLGSEAAALLDDQLRAAASAAGVTLPAADANQATMVASLDALAISANRLSSSAAMALATLNASDVTSRALPAKVSFTSIGGVLVGNGHGVGGGGVVRAVPGPAEDVGTLAQPAAGGVHGLPVGALPAAPIVRPRVSVDLTGTDARLGVIRDAFAAAVGRFVRPGLSTTPPAAAGLDLGTTRTALLANLDPQATIARLAAARIPQLTSLTQPGRDPVAPVMAGPVFSDGAFLPLAQAAHDAFVPGLDAVPSDSVTLVQTNPTFIAAYLAGLNSALGHELLWRGYPTDERGTYWYGFWGASPEIRPLHQFTGTLRDNVIDGSQPLLVLVLRGRLLRRYPDSDIYAVLAGTANDVPDLDAPATTIVRPLFRDFLEPDFTLVGFPLTYESVVGTGASTGYWFVVAEHPGRPRFGLVDSDPAVTHPPLPSWDELTWDDLGPSAGSAEHLRSTTPPMTPAGTTRRWGASAADMAAITYQPAVRVAIRARDLLRGQTS
jgi:hypothetical protein